MHHIITIVNIESTFAYKNAPSFLQKNILKKENRVLLEKGFIHFNITGEYLSNIGNRNIQIVKEIINNLKLKENDNTN